MSDIIQACLQARHDYARTGGDPFGAQLRVKRDDWKAVWKYCRETTIKEVRDTLPEEAPHDPSGFWRRARDYLFTRNSCDCGSFCARRRRRSACCNDDLERMHDLAND